jgi:hypothetical protein
MFLTKTEVYWKYYIVGANTELVYNFRKNYLLVVDATTHVTKESFDDIYFNSEKDFEVEGQLSFLSTLKFTFGKN